MPPFVAPDIGFVFRKDQFAEVVNGGLWWWTFNLLDFQGNDVAVIDRNWRGLGLEVPATSHKEAAVIMSRFGSNPAPKNERE